MVRFHPYDLPVAYSMIAAARRLDARREGYHPFQQYFYYWAAFNNIYTTIAFAGNNAPSLKLRPDKTVETETIGSVLIPKVKPVSERKQIESAIAEFDDKLKHRLITHPSTEFFFNRTPSWHGNRIEADNFGQMLNGVINVNHTVDVNYPVWSPIDPVLYPRYMTRPDDSEAREFLAKQIVKVLYTVRCNLMHGGKRYDDANDETVVEHAIPLLRLIVAAFTE